MTVCPKCRVQVRGGQKLCPLCQSPLPHSQKEPPLYPPPAFRRRRRIFALKLMRFFTLLFAAAAVVVNRQLPQSGNWDRLVLLGMLSLWLLTGVVLWERHRLPRLFCLAFPTAAGLCCLWDGVTGWNGWGLSYAVPCAAGGTVLLIGLMALLLRMPPELYLFPLLVGAMYGLVPLVLLLQDRVQPALPTYICLGLSAAALFYLLLFRPRELGRELHKRFLL